MGEVYRIDRRNESFPERFIKGTNRLMGGSVGCTAGFYVSYLGGIWSAANSTGSEALYRGLSPDILHNVVQAALQCPATGPILGTVIGLLGANYINSFLFGKR